MIISSQRHIDEAIVNEKIEQFESEQITEIVLQTWAVGGEFDDMEMLFDGHHTFEAAQRLGITVRFEQVECPESLTGEDLLEQFWMDSDWYDIETGSPAF